MVHWIPYLVLLKAATSLHVLGIQLGLGISVLGSALGRRARAVAAANLITGILFFLATQLFMPEQLRIAFAQTAPSLRILWLLGLALYFASTLLPKARVSLAVCRLGTVIGAGFALVSVCLQDGLGGSIAATNSNWGIPIPEAGVALRLATIVGASYFLGALITFAKKGLPLNTGLVMAWIAGLEASVILISHKIGFVERIDGIANQLPEAVGFGWALFALGLLFVSRLSRQDHLSRECAYAVIPAAYLMTVLGFWAPSLLKLPAASIDGYYANGLEITESRVFRRANFLREGSAARDDGQEIFRQQCAGCHAQKGPWRLTNSLSGWDRKRLSLFLESVREADQPSSKLFGKMPPLLGSDREIEALTGFLFDEGH